jgi:hypothetical protein
MMMLVPITRLTIVAVRHPILAFPEEEVTWTVEDVGKMGIRSTSEQVRQYGMEQMRKLEQEHPHERIRLFALPDAVLTLLDAVCASDTESMIDLLFGLGDPLACNCPSCDGSKIAPVPILTPPQRIEA